MTRYHYGKVTLKGSPSSPGTDVEWLSIPVEPEEHKAGARVTGQPFRVPADVLKALGDGDLPMGYAAMCDTFGMHTLAQGCGLIPAELVKEIGQGDLNAGRRVLHKFLAIARSQRTKTKAA